MKFSTLIALFAVSAISESQAIRLGEHAKNKGHEKEKDANFGGSIYNNLNKIYLSVSPIVDNLNTATQNAQYQQKNLTQAVDTTNQAVTLLDNATQSLNTIILSINNLNTTIQSAYALIQQSNKTVVFANTQAQGIIDLQTDTLGLASSIKGKAAEATKLYVQQFRDVNAAIANITGASMDMVQGQNQNQAALNYLYNYNYTNTDAPLPPAV